MKTKQILGYLITAITFSAGFFGLSVMNDENTHDIWEKSVITVNDREMAELANRLWLTGDIPFTVEYTSGEADITVYRGKNSFKSEDTLGEATTDNSFFGDKITGCKIELTSGASQGTMTHELGHCFGLGHIHSEKHGSNMNTWQGVKEFKEYPTIVDTSELEALYAK